MIRSILAFWQAAPDTISFIACILALTLLVFVWKVCPKLADRLPEIIEALNRRMARKAQLKAGLHALPLQLDLFRDWGGMQIDIPLKKIERPELPPR